MTKTLPPLPYAYNSLEPYIDEQTLKIHHDKHHQTYLDKYNAAIANNQKIQSKSVKELLENLDSVPKNIRIAVKNHGGGFFNHAFFWPLLKKDIVPKGKILKKINQDFGSFSKFKEDFSISALNLFGSGWTWLVLNQDKLEILNTQNQESPISMGKKPLLVIDVWEHAYYLKYQNRRADYINAFFNIINWEVVNQQINT